MRLTYKEVEASVLSCRIALQLLLPRLLPRRLVAAGQRGQGLVEYALILVLVAIVVIGVLTTMGTRIQAAFDDVVANLNG